MVSKIMPTMDDETIFLNNQGSKVNQDKRWEQRFHQLREFKQINNHCCVTSTDKRHSQLCTWVRHQRHLYKLKCKGEASSLTMERINLLNSIGFVWDMANCDPTWNNMYQELIEFKKSNGHCNVTLRMDDHKPLAKWVMNQRRSFRENRSVMLGERKAKLDAIGFEWHRHKYSWDESFEQLKQFKATYGHDDPPLDSKEYRRLRIWVQNQRTMRRTKQTGKISVVIKERIKKLESMGFRFKRKRKNKERKDSAEESFERDWICYQCSPYCQFKYKTFASLMAHDAIHHSS